MLHTAVPDTLPSWPDAHAALLDEARETIAAGAAPRAVLSAFQGDEQLATVALRPFGTGELTDVLVETLALLLPIGADRLALCVPGRAWSTDDPVPPVTPDEDLRTPVLVVVLADAHDQPCDASASLHPFDLDGPRGRLDPPARLGRAPTAPAIQAMRVLLDGRHDLARDDAVPDLHVAAQLARVLLLGHTVILSPRAAERLEGATTVRRGDRAPAQPVPSGPSRRDATGGPRPCPNACS